MPIHKIQVNEYECGNCRYKWINYKNGKEGPVPKCCAKCKKTTWLDPDTKFTPEEVGLRRKVKKFREQYFDTITLLPITTNSPRATDWPFDLSEVFLSLKDPRPTYRQLKKIVYPFGDPEKWKWIPSPGGARGYVINPNMNQIKIQEFKERKRLMLQIIKDRGITYDVDRALLKMRLYTEEGLKRMGLAMKVEEAIVQ